MFLTPSVFAQANARKYNSCRNKIRNQNNQKIRTKCAKQFGKDRRKVGSCQMKEAMAFLRSPEGKKAFEPCEKFNPRKGSTNTRAKKQGCNKKLQEEIRAARKRYQQCLR